MKIIAWYLPQFHEIKENNEWWGDGFTEWVNVKKAKPLFKNHPQPRVPLNSNYYNLLDENTLIWQSKIAQENGIYGFAYYHYWSNGQLLLEKPAELMLRTKDVTIPFCFSWANHTWKRTWGSSSNEILREQVYGDESEWVKHFEYMLPFFKDNRYIKIDGKPVFIIYLPDEIPEFDKMSDKWNKLAKTNGFEGICFITQNESKKYDGLYTYNIDYQPFVEFRELNKKPITIFKRFCNKYLDIRLKRYRLTYDYDYVWDRIIHREPSNEKNIPGAFVDWDDSPRRDNRGNLCVNVSPQLFEKYMRIQVDRAKSIYHKDMIFLFAWNEWGECGYLEPDELRGYGMLNALRKALTEA